MNNLQKIRIEKGLSQGQLAIKAKVNKRTIEAWEQGVRNINHAQAETLYRIARILGCSIEDLLEKD